MLVVVFGFGWIVCVDFCYYCCSLVGVFVVIFVVSVFVIGFGVFVELGICGGFVLECYIVVDFVVGVV